MLLAWPICSRLRNRETSQGVGDDITATENAALKIAESVMEITPNICKAFHVGTAIESGRYEVAKLLLNHKKIRAELEAGISYDRPRANPIFAAVKMGQTELVDDIIEIQGLDVLRLDFERKSVLHHAVENGHLGLMRRFFL